LRREAEADGGVRVSLLRNLDGRAARLKIVVDQGDVFVAVEAFAWWRLPSISLQRLFALVWSWSGNERLS
jgi:hypothetical protein